MCDVIMAPSTERMLLQCLITLSTPFDDVPQACSSPTGSIASTSVSFSSTSNSEDCIDLDSTENCLSISPVPIYHLDYARAIESFDFCTNGIEQDLDEYDLYQINLRSMICPVNKSNRSCLLSNHTTPNRVSCVFCRNNGEPLSIYGSHVVKDTFGRVTCPILRRYTCPICRSSGDDAHTIKYCPLNVNRISSYRRR